MRLPYWGRLSVLLPVAVVIFSMAALALAWQLKRNYDLAVEAAREQASGLTQVLADDISSTLMGADGALLDTIETFSPAVLGSGAPDARVAAFLRHRVEHAPYIFAISTIDAHGLSVNTSLPNRPPLDLSGRSYFMAHRDDPSPNLRISPMVRTVTTGQWTLWLSRRLSRPGGDFAGVIHAAIAPDYFSHFYDAIKAAPDSSVTLYSETGTVLARQPFREEEIGRDAKASALFKTMLGQSPSGVFEQKSLIDGKRRIVGYAKLPGLPAVVTVGLSIDAIASEALQEGGIFIGIAILIGAVLAALVGLARQLALRLVYEAMKEQADDERNNQLLLLRSLIEAFPAAVFFTDEHGRYRGANRRFLDFVGEALDGILGRTVADAMPAEEARPLVQLSGKVFEAKAPEAVDFTIRREDGSERHFRALEAAYGKADGSLGGAVGIILDITDDILREIDLKTARKAAEDANKAKSNFLASMSHELRTPLNSILGFSEVLQVFDCQNGLSSRCSRNLRHIHASGLHLLNLINDILDLSKIESGKMEIEPQPLALAPLVEDVCASLRETASQKGLTLDSELPAGLPLLWADERSVRQILLNLLSNAIKFTPEGGAVGVGAAVRSNGIDLIVADNGIGIPEGQLDRVLKPFEQLDNRFSRTHGGTGLGLSLVRGLVELHGGHLGIDSKSGQGTRFTVWLPAYGSDGT